MEEKVPGPTTASNPTGVIFGMDVGERSCPVHLTVLHAAVSLVGEATVQALDRVQDDDGPGHDHRPGHHPPLGHAAKMVRALLVLGHIVGVHRSEVASRFIVPLLVATTRLAAQTRLQKAVPS